MLMKDEIETEPFPGIRVESDPIAKAEGLTDKKKLKKLLKKVN